MSCDDRKNLLELEKLSLLSHTSPPCWSTNIFVDYPEQTIEHATDAQRLLSFPNRSGEKPEKSEIVDTAILATYLLGRALLALKR